MWVFIITCLQSSTKTTKKMNHNLLLCVFFSFFSFCGADGKCSYLLCSSGRSDAVSVGISRAIVGMEKNLNTFTRIKSWGSGRSIRNGGRDDATINTNYSTKKVNDDIVSLSSRAVTKEKKITTKTKQRKKYGNGLPPVSAYNRPLSFWENMICGAVSRSVAQTIMHPANTMKTILQSRSSIGPDRLTVMQLTRPKNFKLLTRGAGAQFILSLPTGAVNFSVLEYVRKHISKLFEKKDGSNNEGKYGPGLDFVSSAISTICCSVVSTPQMMITDNIMAGTYTNLGTAFVGLVGDKGIKGLYSGWWPGVAGKIPSYGLTWVFFQQLKRLQLSVMKRDPKDIENSIMGCMASATTVCIMIPMDTIKTRLVTQANYPDLVPYRGIIDCARRVTAEEGVKAFYRGLTPRLISVVPMIGIQFGVYEFMKKVVLANNAALSSDDEDMVMLNANLKKYGGEDDGTLTVSGPPSERKEMKKI